MKLINNRKRPGFTEQVMVTTYNYPRVHSVEVECVRRKSS